MSCVTTNFSLSNLEIRNYNTKNWKKFIAENKCLIWKKICKLDVIVFHKPQNQQDLYFL